MRRRPIGFTDGQHERLRREAGDRRVSVATLVREAVERTFPADAKDRRAARARARTAFGQFRSGLPDLSERHDDYLNDGRW